jgi:hypothetical protein
MVVNGRRNSISQQLALLIEEKYGYSADWILYDEGDKRSCPFKTHKMFVELKLNINQLSSDNMNTVFRFILSLEENDKKEKEKRRLKKQIVRHA